MKSPKKVFWLSFLSAMAILLPVYAAVYFSETIIPRHSVGVAEPQSGISIDAPTLSDSRNIFVVIDDDGDDDDDYGDDGSGGDATRFVLLRFDAWQERIAISFLRDDTLLSGDDGSIITLQSSFEYAGPGYAAGLISSTLSIDIDDYIKLSSDAIIELGEEIGPVKFSKELIAKAGAGALTAEDGTAAMSAKTLATFLNLFPIDKDVSDMFYGEVYSLFMQASIDRLGTIFSDLLTGNSDGLSTDITAAEIYDYQRLLGFFAVKNPKVEYMVFEGALEESGFALAEKSLSDAERYFS